NMARGKPSKAQLDLSMDMLTIVDSDTDMDVAVNVDARNYGGLIGIEGARELIASMVDAKPEQVVMGGNSSLNLMFDTVTRGMISGYLGNTPWCKLDKVKWLCPVPGYDRHFAVTEHYGIEMINIPMTEDGPDMDMVEELVSSDPAIKGIWCVPKFTNPQGIVYSDETVRRMAALKPAAPDFRVFWDNAYCVHYLYDEVKIPNILELAKEYGNEDMIFEFVSTSKISFAGAGVAGIVASKANLDDIEKTMTVRTIGHDKLNQLRHAIFFENGNKILNHMKLHADILRPKFEVVLDALDREVKDCEIGSWTKPQGGYFITFKSLPGCATRIITLAKEAGMVMTGAGAPFPYHKDPEDAYIRIAPSFPTVEELAVASELFAVCVKLASVEKLLSC
ncbi:MAG: aminotransferase, partial [Lachnospiraceae bacterium]|nr:aminotransferase [Lachnospiraceae bacterium]